MVLLVLLAIVAVLMVATAALVVVVVRRTQREAERTRAVVRAYRRIDAIESEALQRMAALRRSGRL